MGTAARIAPGPAMADLLRPVDPASVAHSPQEMGARLRSGRRGLGLDLRDGARAAFVPVHDLMDVEVGMKAFATEEAYALVLERFKSAAAWRARRGS